MPATRPWPTRSIWACSCDEHGAARTDMRRIRMRAPMVAVSLVVSLQAWGAVDVVSAQPPRPGGRRMNTPVLALKSPEVHPDRRVTLRFRAPEAEMVHLVGEITQGRGPQPMTRDAEGIWTITVGPLPPEIWSYNFRVQGVDVP